MLNPETPTVEEVAEALGAAADAMLVVASISPPAMKLWDRFADLRVRVKRFGIAQPIPVTGTIGGAK